MNANNTAAQNSTPTETPEMTAKTVQVLADITAMLNAESIFPNEVQQQMLKSHIGAMVRRSFTGEPLPEVELSLFEEISDHSMKMAENVVSWFGNLPIEEAWLLSVHFEVAKDNES